jgi:starch phosphorylase
MALVPFSSFFSIGEQSRKSTFLPGGFGGRRRRSIPAVVPLLRKTTVDNHRGVQMAKASNSAPKNIRNGLDAETVKWDFAETLKYTMGVDSYSATEHDRYMALAYAVRDRLINQWLQTQRTHHDKDVKRVYYLSLEFLMGRAMGNNVINSGIEGAVRKALDELGYDFEELREQEIDAGLGNGGLGRLAACFIDSMATLDLPAFGYGLRYDYGIFRQEIDNGYQVEHPDDFETGIPGKLNVPIFPLK